MNRAIQCRYSCKQCGIFRRTVTVPARGDENVVDWLNKVACVALAADHARQSPSCRIESLSEVLVPMYADNEKIGGAGDVLAKTNEEPQQ